MHCHACHDARCATATTTAKTTTRCRARLATSTLLILQLQHASVFADLLLHCYYDNYNALPCLL